MSELCFDDPCVLFALRREAAAFCREFRRQQRFPGGPGGEAFRGPAWLTVLTVWTGMGPTRSRAALDWLLSRPFLGNVAYRPRVVIAAGYSGGLDPALAVGDVVLGTEVVDATGKVWPATWPAVPPSGEWRPPLKLGRIMSVAEPVATAAGKADLFRQAGALAVDMESATVAAACAAAGVPFGCVRVISDTAATSLSPGLTAALAGGSVSLPRLAAAVARSPGVAVECWRLARDSRRAGKQLAEALGELLTLTLPWGAEL